MSESPENKKEYKDTLNLPKTDFPMKADLSKREPAILQKWNELKLYQKLRSRLRWPLS